MTAVKRAISKTNIPAVFVKCVSQIQTDLMDLNTMFFYDRQALALAQS